MKFLTRIVELVFMCCLIFIVILSIGGKGEETQSKSEIFQTPATNKPNFSEEDLDLKNGYWQTFSDLDSLNRVGVANAMLHKDFMPSEERGDISNVYPTGWKQKKLKDGKWLYNRSHLIGFQLTGENDNWKNLFTGTQELNQVNMVQYENKIATYLRTTNNHVRYRVTPIFRENELLPRAITLEAQSVEDNEISFNVTLENEQSDIEIDYQTGKANEKKPGNE